jgi:hypothetical protein
MLKCLRCDKALEGVQTKWCSQLCKQREHQRAKYYRRLERGWKPKKAAGTKRTEKTEYDARRYWKKKQQTMKAVHEIAGTKEGFNTLAVVGSDWIKNCKFLFIAPNGKRTYDDLL